MDLPEPVIERIQAALRIGARKHIIAHALNVPLDSVRRLSRRKMPEVDGDNLDFEKGELRRISVYRELKSYIADLIVHYSAFLGNPTMARFHDDVRVGEMLRRLVRDMADMERHERDSMEFIWKMRGGGQLDAGAIAGTREWVVKIEGPDGGDPFEE